jgi:hypothetical protein
MFKWYTLCPFPLAKSAKGANFRIGDSGMEFPRVDSFGMFLILKCKFALFFVKFLYLIVEFAHKNALKCYINELFSREYKLF